MGKKFIIPGFQFSGVSAGIKPGRKKDLALIYSEVPATAVGTFTTHPAAAAPVLLSKRRIRSGRVRSVVINSGNANAGTGKGGERAAAQMATRVAQQLKIPQAQSLVCSTGVIGVPLPMPRVRKGIDRAVSQLNTAGLSNAAEAILTTDQGVKLASQTGRIGRKPYQLVGFAKGAGMIEPHMELVRGRPHATMLAFILTDLAVDLKWARRLIQASVEESFNRITVDGDTSTNDTCLLLANGLAGNAPLKTKAPGARRFAEQVFRIMYELALAMVADGEGATKVVEIVVQGAKNPREARQAAYAIANSQLVRTSFYGGDPNWGRVLAALGNSGATCTPSWVDISYGGVVVCRRGLDTGPAAQRKAKQAISRRKFTLKVVCGTGKATHTVLSSDLGLDYVKLNSHYRS
jgi:glutamate N-acetyltransferase/amino-acid N-acetyltransferase